MHQSNSTRLRRTLPLEPACAVRTTLGRPVWFLVAAILIGMPIGVARAQDIANAATPLVPEMISDSDVEISGRYVRQFREDDGTFVLVVEGAFRLDFARKRLAADNGVVWLTPRHDEASDRRYFELVVYLTGNAEIVEPGGTTTVDEVLLVSRLRSAGRVTKSHDAHDSSPKARNAPLYRQAWEDRLLIEDGVPPDEPIAAVARPRAPRVARPPSVVRYEVERFEPASTPPTPSAPNGERVYVATDGVYFSQAGGPKQPLLEIRARSAVVFPVPNFSQRLLDDSNDDAGQGGESAAIDQPSATPAGSPGSMQPVDGAPSSAIATADSAPRPPAPAPSGPLAVGPIQGRIRAVYLEGDVQLSLGDRFIRASRLYYDFELQRAVILDGVFRTDVPDRQVPLYVRADEIRQLSATEFSAENARITTSEFFTPHYHVGVEQLYLRDVTARDTGGRAIAPVAGEYEMKNATLNVGGNPVLFWPYAKGRLEDSETLIKSVRVGQDGDFGTIVQTDWHLFNLLGVTPPPGYDATLRLDYFSDRGPAVGIDADYETDDRYGLLRTYLISDRGVDTQLGPLRRQAWEPSSDTRGRALWRHREYLPGDWQLTLEASYISDPNFLEIYDRSEFNEGKEQETVFFLKRARGTEAITFLANWRLLDFVTQTEHLPDLVYRRIGDTLDNTPLVFYHESRLGVVRYRPDDRFVFDDRPFSNLGLTDSTARVDVREEVEAPIKLGWINLVPFATGRGTYWDGMDLHDGGLWRGFGAYGVRGSSQFWRIYPDVQSDLWDLNGIRHIVNPYFVAWFAHSNVRSDRITPFDEGIETIDDFYGGKLGVRQIWQTKRGGLENAHTVDWLTVDLELGAFTDAQANEISNGYVNEFRPEDSRSRNYIAGDVAWRAGDTTTILYDFNFDMSDRSYDRHSVALAVERNPRFAYILGARYAGDIDMNLVGGGWNYRLNEKHITAFRLWHDIGRGDLGEVAFAYIRRLPRWYAGLSFEWDNVDNDFSVSFSLWPEGIPEWALGSRRFNDLANSIGLRP